MYYSCSTLGSIYITDINFKCKRSVTNFSFWTYFLEILSSQQHIPRTCTFERTPTPTPSCDLDVWVPMCTSRVLWYTYRQIKGQTDKQKTDRQTKRQTDKQKDTETNKKQRDKQKDRQTENNVSYWGHKIKTALNLPGLQ